MAEKPESQSSTIHQVPDPSDNTVTLRVPKPNMQVAILGLVAFITLFQTVQLMRIGAKAASAPAKAAPAAASTNSGGSGSNADIPQSMVGGC